MKRLLLPGLALSAGLFVGCVESTLNPTDTVMVKGTALAEDKTPLAETTLKLHRSLNSVCLAPDHYKDLKTDAQGGWQHELTGAETQNGELARCFELRLPQTEKGAGASVRFLMQVTQIEVPELQTWNGSVTVDDSGPGAQVAFKKISETHDFEAAGSIGVALEDGTAVWSAPAPASPVQLSEYVLEDFDGLKAGFTVARELRGSGTRFDYTFHSERVPLAREAKVPVSRGAACQFGAQTFDAAACPVTDGRLAKLVPGEAAADLRIDLASPVKLRKLVLREFSYSPNASVVIEGSSDGGVTFEPLATVGTTQVGSYAEVDLDEAAPAVGAFRLRVTGDNDPKILTLRQLSLFE